MTMKSTASEGGDETGKFGFLSEFLLLPSFLPKASLEHQKMKCGRERDREIQR